MASNVSSITLEQRSRLKVQSCMFKFLLNLELATMNFELSTLNFHLVARRLCLTDFTAFSVSSARGAVRGPPTCARQLREQLDIIICFARHLLTNRVQHFEKSGPSVHGGNDECRMQNDE